MSIRQKTKFPIKTNLEFYPFLKAHLPDDYKIISEPQKSYYSEWYFRYLIYHSDEVVEEYQGDFREIEDGYLVDKADQILDKLDEVRSNVDW